MNRSEVFPQRAAGDLGQRAGELDAGRSAADDHEGEQPRLGRGVGFTLGGFEREQNLPPDLQRIVQRLETGRARGPFGVAEIGVRGAGRDDEVVVVDAPAIDDHAPPLGLDRLCLRQQHLHV